MSTKTNITKTVKTAILALIIVSATLMGGCLTDADTAKEVTMSAVTTEITVEKVELEIETPEYVDPKYEAAKKIAEENGVVWACEAPTPKATATTTPTVAPTATPTPEPEPTRTFRGSVMAYGHQDGEDRIMVRLDAIQHEMIWIKSFDVEMNGQYVGTVERRDTGNKKPQYDFDAFIILPDGMTHHDGEITITGNMIDEFGNFVGSEKINCISHFPLDGSCHSRNYEDYTVING